MCICKRNIYSRFQLSICKSSPRKSHFPHFVCDGRNSRVALLLKSIKLFPQGVNFINVPLTQRGPYLHCSNPVGQPNTRYNLTYTYSSTYKKNRHPVTLACKILLCFVCVIAFFCLSIHSDRQIERQTNILLL